MIPMSFDYERPETADGALQLLAEHGDDAKLLAGGHSLLPLMKFRLATPEVLIDVGRLTELSYVRVDGDAVAIGALTRHCELTDSGVLQTEAPLIAHAAGLVGDPQVRHRGTIGGSISHGDPASDLPTAVLATGAVLVVRGPNGTREIDAADFFVGFLETALEPDELLVEIRVPRAAGVGWAYEKFVRRSNDWAIVAAAAVDGRVALANMGGTPLRATATERALADGADTRAAADLAAEDTSPVADMHAGVEYRKHLARLLTRRALDRAAS
ncbi:MAG: xanthine dehydrogenase family protein subunit M [Streptosporangiales bacterium]|nr:xanthine dehydrogenase family protein subunit M [Streptosporangiales bacterium]